MQTTENPSKQHLILISIGLVLLTLAAFEPLRHNDFINFDDDIYITQNNHIQSGLTWEAVKWAFTAKYAANWHPLTWLSHMVDIELFGLNPLGHHLHSLLLHTISTLLLFWLLYKMTGDFWPGTFAAIIFAIHPLRVESVAWASERKDVLSVFFFMLTLAAYLYYIRQESFRRYLLVMFCFVLGLMAKPMLVTLPIVLLLLDFWPLNRILYRNASIPTDKRQVSFYTLFAEKIPLFILTIISCIITYLAQHHGKSIASTEHLSIFFRIQNAVISYVAYLEKIFYPHDLAILYTFPTAYPLWQFAIAFLLLFLLSIAVVYFRTQNPYLLTGWLWYLLTLIPVIGLIQVGNQAMADRYTYLPSIGILIMFAWIVASWTTSWQLWKKRSAIILSIITVAALVTATRVQLSYWQNNITLFKHTLAVTQNNYIIHNNLGWALSQDKKLDEAEEHLLKALAIRSDKALTYTNLAIVHLQRHQIDKAKAYLHEALAVEPDDVHANKTLGLLLFEEKHFDEAMECFQKVIQSSNVQEPEVCYDMGTIFASRGQLTQAIDAYQQTIKCNPNYYKAFNNLGAIKAQQGLWDQAIDYFQQCLKINPNYAQAIRNIGLVLQSLDRTEEAIPYFRKTIVIDPNDFPANYNLSLCLQIIGKAQESIETYRKTLQINPDSIEALSDLAWILAATPENHLRNPAEALALAQKTCQLTEFKDAMQLDTLAVAYAATGQFKEAVETAQKAVNIANVAGQTDLASQIEKRRQLYLNGQPYHDQ